TACVATASRPTARSATPTRCRRSSTPFTTRAPRRSSSRPTREGGRTGSPATSSTGPAAASESRSSTSSSTPREGTSMSSPRRLPLVEERITRRGSLAKLGGVLAALAAGGWKVHTSEGAGPAAVASGAVRCVLTPEQTEGPYYIAGEKVRRTITDGRPGTPLTLHLQVVNARPASRSRAPRSTSGTPTPAASTRGSGR